MRITKEPEVRKQEILDTALKLFGENGYEKTSITDIAKAIGVAQGLCCLTARLNNMRMSWWSSLSALERTIRKPCGRSLKICLPLWNNGTQNTILFFTEQKIRNFTINFLSKCARSWFHL